MVAGRSFYLPSSSSFATSGTKDDLVVRLPRPLLLVVRPELLPRPRLPAKISRGASSSGHLLLPPATSRCCSPGYNSKLLLFPSERRWDVRDAGYCRGVVADVRDAGYCRGVVADAGDAGNCGRTADAEDAGNCGRAADVGDAGDYRGAVADVGDAGTAGGRQTSGTSGTAGERWWMPGMLGTAGGPRTSGTPETAGERWTAGRRRIATDKI